MRFFVRSSSKPCIRSGVGVVSLAQRPKILGHVGLPTLVERYKPVVLGCRGLSAFRLQVLGLESQVPAGNSSHGRFRGLECGPLKCLHTCNHLTDAMCIFLLRQHVPPKVLDQPDVVMRSPPARVLHPLLKTGGFREECEILS